AEERFDRARTELPAHLRNRAERTRIRATLAHFDVRVRGAVREEARQVFVQPHRHLSFHRRGVDVARDGRGDRFEVIESHERVDLQLPQHDLGIDEILGTAEADHADALRSRSHGVRGNRLAGTTILISRSAAWPHSVWTPRYAMRLGGHAAWQLLQRGFKQLE